MVENGQVIELYIDTALSKNEDDFKMAANFK
jgi:hypothetical protein